MLTVLIAAAPASGYSLISLFSFLANDLFILLPEFPLLPRAAGHAAKTRWVGALWKPTESAGTHTWLRDRTWLPGLSRG